MNKNIVIQEGDIGRQFTANKLETALQGGGNCLWVSENETQLTTKNITKNGVYIAEEDNVYGWSSIYVNVTSDGAITGTGSDGNKHTITTDDSGNLVDTKIPSSIEVITPPTNPYGIYVDGQTITTEGMVVKAYYEDLTEWGTVPNGEITLEPDRAAYNENADAYRRRVNIDGVDKSVLTYPDYDYELTVNTYLASDNDTWTLETEGINAYLIYFDNGGFVAIADSYTAGDTGYHQTGTRKSDGVTADDYVNAENMATKNGTTYYYMSGSFGASDSNVNGEKSYIYNNGVQIDALSSVPIWDIAYLVFNGTLEPVSGSPQTITASWSRPGDGAVLEDTFEITVGPAGGHGED